MQTVMVTGATGYIGSHVCKSLREAGYKVIGVDLVKRDHALPFMDSFIHDDYNSALCFDALPIVHAVIHCAGTSLVGPSVSDPAEYYVNNVAKTANFLDVIRRQEQAPVFVFSSSAAVYGNPGSKEILENTPWSPMSPYGQSKAMIEIMMADYAKAYNLPVMALRYFNACGADASGELGQAPGATHIIARLLESVRDDAEFTLYGNDYATPDGTCIRDYVHVTDLASAHMLAIQYLQSFGGGWAFNLGSGEGYSNQEIIDAVGRLVKKPKIKIGNRRDGDPDRLVASNALAKHSLTWSPEHSDLGTIINSAWKWYNNPSNLVDKPSK